MEVVDGKGGKDDCNILQGTDRGVYAGSRACRRIRGFREEHIPDIHAIRQSLSNNRELVDDMEPENETRERC